ncbi:MAG: hypothetical protein QXP97_03230 [Desulfurococcus sp.]|uniref:hypothetical protein n=1 Tax=Desulfurococcus sp. TaxID=51678 RepID=UPI00316924E7
MGKAIPLLVLLVSACLLRLIPYIATAQPFSTDVWPLILFSDKLIREPDLKIWDDAAFDGHNNRWPALLLASTQYSILTGLRPEYFFSFTGVVIVAVEIILATYILLRELLGGASILSLYAIALVPSFTLFSSTLLKEVYSYPLMILFLLMALRSSKRSRVEDILVLTLVSLTLVLSHPLSPLMSILFIASYLYSVLVEKAGKGVWHGLSGARGIYVLSLFTILYAVYSFIYAFRGGVVALGYSDFMGLLVIAVAVYGSYMVFKQGPRYVIAPVVMAIVFSALILNYGDALSFSILTLILYIVPVVLFLLPLARLLVVEDVYEPYYASVLLPITLILFYVLLIDPLYLSVMHRVLNYVSFLTPIVLETMDKHGKPLLRLYRLLTTASSLIICFIIILEVSLGSDPVAFYWRYTVGEVIGFTEVRELYDGVICGDSKVAYFYGNANASTLCMLQEYGGSRGLYLYYMDNFKYGYVLSPLDVLRLRSPCEYYAGHDLLYNNRDVMAVGG